MTNLVRGDIKTEVFVGRFFFDLEPVREVCQLLSYLRQVVFVSECRVVIIIHSPANYSLLVKKSLHMNLMAHQAGAYPGFSSMKRLGVFLLPPRWDASPSQG